MNSDTTYKYEFCKINDIVTCVQPAVIMDSDIQPEPQLWHEDNRGRRQGRNGYHNESNHGDYNNNRYPGQYRNAPMNDHGGYRMMGHRPGGGSRPPPPRGPPGWAQPQRHQPPPPQNQQAAPHAPYQYNPYNTPPPPGVRPMGTMRPSRPIRRDVGNWGGYASNNPYDALKKSRRSQ